MANIKEILEPGTIIANRYKIIKLLGSGGMSKVYLVNDIRLNKIWVLKEIWRHCNNNTYSFKQALMTEMRLLCRLEHPYLPRIVDVIDNDQTLSIVMDYIEGRSLETVITEDGSQSIENVSAWAVQLCDVLEYLHTRTPPIIYRDMKPQNILLKPDGNIALIDFGIAREYKTNDLGDTTYLGTRWYAAPEQFGGEGQTDPRTDIYGLGATMYTLLTGQTPTYSQSIIDSILKYRPELQNSKLVKIIAKCCEPDRKNRYQSCTELSAELTSLSRLDLYDFKRVTFLSKLVKFSHNQTDSISRYTQKSSEIKYQVFISFKHTDDFGRETPDAKLAERLYKKLRAKGLKVYFSKKSISDEASDRFKNSISSALKESKILVVVGTRPDYVNSYWVQREFQEFQAKMKHAKRADEYAIYNYLGPGMHINSLPVELRDFMTYDDPEKLKTAIIKRLTGNGRQENLPKEIRAEAVWERVRPGTLLNNRYQLNKCVKKGKYYKLFEASDNNIANEKLRLVKVINNYLLDEGAIDPEIECLEAISDISRGIPLIIDHGKEEDITYLVTDYAHGTRLDQLMLNGAIDESEVVKWMLDLCETLHSLHTHSPQVIHCNIKPANIFVFRGRTELINFSAAYVADHNSKYRGIVMGSRYSAPELTISLSDVKQLNPSADIYSLGYTMKEALLGSDESRTKIHRKISLGMSYILQKCTAADSTMRYQSALELKNDLENINKVGIKAVKENFYSGIKKIFRKKQKDSKYTSFIPGTPEMPTLGLHQTEYSTYNFASNNPSSETTFSTKHFNQTFGETTILGGYDSDLEINDSGDAEETNFGVVDHRSNS